MMFVVGSPDKVSEIVNVAISLDGNTIAFVGISEGRRVLFVRQVNSLESKLLNGTEDASFPFWAPNGRSLGFFSQGKLKRIEVNGGIPQVLCDAPAPGGGTWNRDGVILFGLDNKPLQQVAAASGGQSTTVLPLDQSHGEAAHFWPYFLPDGKHFLYQSWTGRPDDSAIYVTSIEGGDRKQLIKADSNPAYGPPGYLLFARTNTLLAQQFDPRTLSLSGDPIQVSDAVTFNDSYSLSSFSISDNGLLVMVAGTISNRQLTWFDRNGKQLGVMGAPAEYNDVVLSPDEKRLAVQRIDGNGSDVWMIDVSRGLPSRFTFDSRNDDPVWSSDGNILVFSRGQNGIFNIFKKQTNGSGKDELVCNTPENKEGTDWSPDGKYLLIDSHDEEGNLGMWVLPMFGDYKPYRLMNSNFREGQGHFSPDGKWFAYTSDESGSFEVYLRRFPECDNQVRVSNGGGAQPHWRKDGRELFYVASDRKLMAVDVRLGAIADVGTAKPLFTTGIGRYDAPNRYAASGDGQRFLVNTTVQATSQTPITVVVNWTAGLKK